MTPKVIVELDSAELGRFHGRVQKVSVSMPEDLATAIREHTGPGAFSRFVAEAAERQLKSEEFRALLDELAVEAGPIPAELEEQVTREWLRFYEEE
jgi:Arc/MetJ-type ribon-helix-helix transcriptional regulator